VSYVVVHTTPSSQSYPQHELLQETLRGDVQDWELIQSSRRAVLGQTHEIEVYRCRKDLRGVPVHLEIDLTRKIRQSITVGGSGALSPRPD